MKKILTLCLVAVAFGACNNQEKQLRDEMAAQAAVNDATREQLAEAVADRDQLLSLVNEITGGVEQIKSLEKILTVSTGTETPDQRAQIAADIAAIQQTLAERRERLAQLEKKLANSTITNSNLQQTIASLRAQIDAQTEEIAALKANLNEANRYIGQLGAQVDSLNTTVDEVTAARDLAQQESEDLTRELNTCYYAVGTKSELKEHHIIESGFLRKTKLMPGDFDQDFFVTADKRTLVNIPLHSRKAEVMTNQPTNSYVIEDANGQKVLRITDPVTFWSLSNYLVIKID